MRSLKSTSPQLLLPVGDDGTSQVWEVMSLAARQRVLRLLASVIGRIVTSEERAVPAGHARARARSDLLEPAVCALWPGEARRLAFALLELAEHGSRRARVRGHTKVNADFSLLAAAVNLARLATLGITHNTAGWALSTA